MSKRTPTPSVQPTQATTFQELLSACSAYPFIDHNIRDQLNQHGHYDLKLDRNFPLHIALFHLRSGHFTHLWNWHHRLEFLISLDGPLRMRIGERSVTLAPGEVLIVENLKLHNFEDFPGFDTRAIAVTFMPELVYTPGGPACDYSFLLPFYDEDKASPHLLSAQDPAAPVVHRALVDLVENYFSPERYPHAQSGCKSALLRILHQFVCRFQPAVMQRADFVQHRQRAERLSSIFEYVQTHYSEKITVDQAAALVHLSPGQFMRVFRRVAGMTFVDYLTRVRLMHAYTRLRECDRSVADIAAETGFADQSYFDRRFKRAFGHTPRECRHGATAEHYGNTAAPRRS